MILDSRICYRALKARDARFDGRFFVAVSSTRIYCRPVCTVKPPKRENCRFFPSAAAAEAGGYRPCLRCRPELGYPLEAAAWFALIAPAGTPEAIVQRLAREVRRVLSLEAMRRFLDDQGIEAGDLGPEALKAYIASEHARYGRMVRETGVQVE